ncbi:MAG: hypothetical protein JW984_00700 [Deltaproteobacteria bacterium]|uniref:Uncharacterized protein n=1 Tax=Candidatus Zymogenus saltonus TaxID=2844893 RepID=A0A9D8PN43_9DELT|nr:hypothetical protein [Candidatus Zymogenus saltonus]
MILPQRTHIPPKERLLNTKRRLAVTAIVLIITAHFIGATTGEESRTEKDSRFSDPLNISSFLPPEGWVKWDFYGKVLFSPFGDKDTRIAYLVEEKDNTEGKGGNSDKGPESEGGGGQFKGRDVKKGDEDADPDNKIITLRDEKLSEYKRTFSTSNYSMIEIKPVELRGYPGVTVIALGTESNKLFGGKKIWIVEYYTPTYTVSLTFFGTEDKFKEYKKGVEASFHSLIIY